MDREFGAAHGSAIGGDVGILAEIAARGGGLHARRMQGSHHFSRLFPATAPGEQQPGAAAGGLQDDGPPGR